MDKGKKTVIIIFSIFIIFIIILAFLITYNDNTNNEINSSTPNNGNNSTNNSNLENNQNLNTTINQNEHDNKYTLNILTNEEVFFGIQSTLNNYYYLLSIKDNENLAKILEPSFKNEHNINQNNASSIIKSSYQTVTFVAKEIYYYNYNNLKYFFVNGYLINNDVNGYNMEYEKSVNYIIITLGSEYVIKPLNIKDSIYDYALSYDLVDVDVSSEHYINEVKFTTDIKLETYLNEFISLMLVDAERAYSMLADDMLIKYPNLQSFKKNINNIYKNIETKVFSFNTQTNDDAKIYTIMDINAKKIIITEKAIMDYKIYF